MINEKCIKCGNIGATLKYIGNIIYTRRVMLNGKELPDKAIPEYECIEVACIKCGYKWRVEPLEKRVNDETH